jgi:hypothetical protein
VWSETSRLRVLPDRDPPGVITSDLIGPRKARFFELAAAGRGAGLLGGAVEGEQAEVKGLAIRHPSPEQERPDRNCDRAFVFPGARDRARTGDPHVGNVFRPLDSAAFSRETAAGSRIGHARVAAMLRGRYARRDAAGFKCHPQGQL